MACTSPLGELHKGAGAAFGEFLGCELPARFTSFDVEYQAARKTVALFDASYLACFHFAGPDRVRYLNAVTTSDVKSLRDGEGNIGLLLNPQGRILAELVALALPDRLMVLSHASVRERTAETLNKFIIMDDVTMSDATDQTGAVAVEGPSAAAILYESCGVKLAAMAEFAHREAILGAIPCRVVRRSHFGQPGALLLGGREQLAALWQTLLDAVRRHGGSAIGYDAVNTLRLEAGVPWFAHDFDDKVIPHEAALEFSHISYTKGCYTGQEIVERVRARGHVNRRRVGLRFSSESASPGRRLLFEGKEVGSSTSAAFSPLAAASIGMGYVRREHSAPGTKLECESGTAEVIQLPLPAAK